MDSQSTLVEIYRRGEGKMWFCNYYEAVEAIATYYNLGRKRYQMCSIELGVLVIKMIIHVSFCAT